MVDHRVVSGGSISIVRRVAPPITGGEISYMEGAGRRRERMKFDWWTEFAARHRQAVALAALVVTFAGVALLIDRPKGTVLEWLALPFLVAGGALFALAVWRSRETGAAPFGSMAGKLIDRITLHGKLIPIFPPVGAGIVLVDIGYNWFLSATPAIQTEDTMVLLAAATLICYPFVPVQFARERDFAFVFFLCLNAILVAPLLIARAYFSDFERSVDLYSWVALAPETSGILQLIGVANTVHPVAGSTAPGLSFTPQHLSVQVTVVITTACSGIYSFGIFASAFVAFLLTESAKLSNRLWVFLGIGLASAYFANVLRMVIIVLVGYYTASPETELQDLLIAHSYAGWLIFLGWITLFWGALFKFDPLKPLSEGGNQSRPNPRRSEPVCSICSEALSPTVPATRCACGIYYHRVCHVAAGRCPMCGRQPAIDATVTPEAS